MGSPEQGHGFVGDALGDSVQRMLLFFREQLSATPTARPR